MSSFLQPNLSWLSYPMKPIRINDGVFSTLNKNEYTIEAKFDGFRLTIIAGHNEIFAFTRQKNVLKLPKNLQEELLNMKFPPGTVLDGEIWSPLKRSGWDTLPVGSCKISFWDVIRHGTTNVTNKPIESRRDILKSLLTKSDNVDQARIYEASESTIRELRTLAVEAKLEMALRSGFIHGVVLKKNGSPRRDHSCRSIEHADWLKLVWF